MGRQNRHRLGAVVVLAAALAASGTVTAAAQWCGLLCPGEQQTGDSTTTTSPVTLLPPEPTTPPPPAPDPAAPPPADAPADPGSTEPPPDTTAPPADGTTTLPEDLGEGDDAGREVPSEARAVIDSIVRTPANDNDALVDGVAALEAVGMPHDEAARAVYGRFPVQGPSHWSDDWYFPRWTGTTFRFHQGLDMFAAYGTPIGAPADGVARIADNALGGLTVRVVEPDGTFWYLAHLSAVAEGLVDGAAVSVGQVVGYVGDSGNARGGAPHLHFGYYPQGGAAAPPKPHVDEWVAEGAERVVALLAERSATQPTAAIQAADLTRRIAEGVVAGPELAAGPPRSELLWASAASPNGGAVAVADAAAASLNEAVDWERRAAEQRSLDLAWEQARDRAWLVLGPLVHPSLRPGAIRLGQRTPSGTPVAAAVAGG
jgi:hypothetical protein